MKKTILALAILAASFAASAQVYVEGNIGRGNVNADCSDFASCDHSSTGGKLVGGFKINPNVAVEATYFSFGKANASDGATASGYGHTLSANVAASAKSSGVGLGVAGFLPVSNDVNLIGRLGIAKLKATGNASASVSLDGRVLASDSESESESHTAPYFGIGVSYAINKNLSVNAAADFSKAKLADETANVRLLSVGVGYTF